MLPVWGAYTSKGLFSVFYGITNPRLCSKKNCKESSALNLCKTGSQASDLYGKAKIS